MKITKKRIEKTEYIDTCPICKKEIKGNSESQIKYNINYHIKQKHKKERKK